MPQKPLLPAAFLSYARADDKYGHISEFRQQLEDEVSMQTGKTFRIFQDRRDIQLGQSWRDEIEDALDAVTFLIPILTPRFFKSEPCGEELRRFRERETALDRDDLILPVYYVDTPLLNPDPGEREKDPVAELVYSRQYADWRTLRYEPFTSPEIRKQLAGMARQIRDAIERLDRADARSEPVLPANAGQSPQKAGGSTSAKGGATRGPSPQVDLPTHVVDAWGRGGFRTIGDAIAAAAPGDRIVVREGQYEEGIVLDKTLEIIGEGEVDRIIVRAVARTAVEFRSSMGRLVNLTIRQVGGGRFNCVDISQGRLEIEGCDISSDGLACVAIYGGANPLLRLNRIHDGRQGGVFVYGNAQGTLEDNDIHGNALAGVEIRDSANPTLRRNRIYDGKRGGVFIHAGGQGTLEDNEIRSNSLAGVEIRDGANPTLRRNVIQAGKESGVYIHSRGEGTLEGNDISGNRIAGISIKAGGNPLVRDNRINDNPYGVMVYEKGRGRFENNDLSRNAYGAWSIARECEADVSRRNNRE
jgi:parallel beta-helix repeat protein